MKQYIGNISQDLCNELMYQCKQHDVNPYRGHMELDPTDKFYKDYLTQTQAALAAGYGDSVEFRHYYPSQHFSLDFVTEFERIVNTTSLLCFVSEIRPGKCAPWHWDINPWLDTYPSGQVVRYACFIDTPNPGQAFMIEDDCFYMEQQGNIYQYPSLNSWHAGFNAGLKTKFLFTFTGLRKV